MLPELRNLSFWNYPVATWYFDKKQKLPCILTWSESSAHGTQVLLGSQIHGTVEHSISPFSGASLLSSSQVSLFESGLLFHSCGLAGRHNSANFLEDCHLLCLQQSTLHSQSKTASKMQDAIFFQTRINHGFQKAHYIEGFMHVRP